MGSVVHCEGSLSANGIPGSEHHAALRSRHETPTSLVRMQEVFGYSAIAALGAAAVFSSFPLWKSAKLSPDSIQRRVWWSCCAAATVSVFFSQLPYWPGGLFAATMTALALIAIAGFRTNFIKINGRVYGAFSQDQPDRPPALAREDPRD